MGNRPEGLIGKVAEEEEEEEEEEVGLISLFIILTMANDECSLLLFICQIIQRHHFACMHYTESESLRRIKELRAGTDLVGNCVGLFQSSILFRSCLERLGKPRKQSGQPRSKHHTSRI
jgi:hypothetical protein